MGGNDILFHAAGQSANAAFFRAFRHGPDGSEIAVRNNGEARFNNIHPQRFQLHGHLYFLLHVHRRAGALFPVSQRRIKNVYMFFHYNNHVKGSFLRKLRAEKYSDEGAIPSAHNYQDLPFTSLAPERPAGAYQDIFSDYRPRSSNRRP